MAGRYAGAVKGQSFRRRLGFALAGIRSVWRTEASFRTQVRLGMALPVGVTVLRPGAVWVALVVTAGGLVLALEAVNAAIEYLADALHPDHHPLVGAAKDVAAGAVLIAGLTAVVVAAAAVYSSLP